MASRIASFVGSVQLRLKIEQATSTEDEPTPIYLLDEVVREIGSTSKNVSDAVDVIQQRLHHRSPTVKQKALKLVKHAAHKGSPELRRSLTRHSTILRELTHFRCPPDPFKGDIPWKRVQEFAKEALDALHAAPPPPTTSLGTGSQYQYQQQYTSNAGMGSRMQGFGNDTGGGGSGSGGYGASTATSNATSRMQGFGSDSTRMEGTSILDYQSRDYRAPIAGAGGSSAMLEQLSTGVRDFTDRAVGALTRPQHERLNSSDSQDDEYRGGGGRSLYYDTGAGGGYQQPIIDRSGAQPSSTTAPLPEAAPTPSTASKEYRLVDKICTPSGVRSVPGSEDLKNFVTALSSSSSSPTIHGPTVAVALEKKMELGSWQETLRALCALEAVLLESSTFPVAGEIAVHFHGAGPVGVVKRAAQSTQTTVRQRAERVLKLLGAETLPDESATTTTTTTTSGGIVDLLGGGGSDGGGGGGGATAVDLLAGLDVVPTTTTNTTTTTNGGGGMTNSTANAIDVLGDLMGGGGGALQPQPQRQLSSSSPAVDDMFGDWSTAPPPAPSPIATAATTMAATTPDAVGSGGGGGGIDLLLGGISDLSLGGVGGIPSPPASSALPKKNIPLDDFFTVPPPPPPTLPSSFAMDAQSPPPSLFSTTSMPGMNVSVNMTQSYSQPATSLAQDNVLGAINAATSGISSAKREDVAFDFVQSTMAQLKKK